MHRLTKAAAAVAVTAGLSVTGATAASADAAPHYRLNGTDARFLRSNEQVNLAEITVGKIVLNRSRGPAARNLARVTISDHRKARAANMALAQRIGIREPDAPNAMQQRVAKHLMKAARINRDYFIAQIAGHKQSIAATKHEIRNGIRPRVVAYAKQYLPVAQMHLRMAQRDLKRWQREHQQH